MCPIINTKLLKTEIVGFGKYITMRAHTDEEIINCASAVEKEPKEIKDNRIDITIDLNDEHNTAHTYTVSFCRDTDGDWQVVEVLELSSL